MQLIFGDTYISYQIEKVVCCMPLILARHLPFFFYQHSLPKSVSLWKGFHAFVTPSRGAATHQFQLGL